MQDDDKLYGLIAQAGDIQKHAVTLQQVAQEAVKGLPGGYKEAVKGAAREILTEAAQNASTALLEACNEAKASSSALRRTGLLQAVFLLAVALIIAGASLGGLNWFIKSRLSELAEVKSAIQAEKATLADLQSKTWKLELITFSDGSRGVILPKGKQYERITTMEDGRAVVLLK